MASISYFFSYLGSVNPLNTYTPGYQYAQSVTYLNNGGFFNTFQGFVPGSPGYNYVDGRILNASGTPITPEIAASNFNSYDAETATLKSGNVVSAYTSPSGSSSTIGFNIYSPSGSYITSATTGSGTNYNADVARLNDGGFVISYDHQFSSTDLDTCATIFNADGSVRTSIFVNTATYYTNQSAVTGLANGNFVVSYAKETAVGSGSYQLAFQIYSASGAVVRGETIADAIGTTNTPGEAISLKDGGFAVVYNDNGWSSGTDEDITLGIWNADGSFRTWVQANAPLGTVGYQYYPTVTQLDNGYILVGWSNAANSNTEYSVWTATGALITSGTWRGSSFGLNFASAANGVLSGLATDTAGDGDGYGVSSDTRALTRYTQGDATAETLTGDSLSDYMLGNAGSDTLNGMSANDTLDGGSGNDRVDGGVGNDLIYGSAGADTLIGGAGVDTLSYLTSLSGVTLDLATPGANTGDALGDVQSGFEQFQGTSYNDKLYGDGLANKLDGADGDDLVVGRAGADSLTGGYGNDTLDGGSENDRLDGGGNDDLLIGGAGADALIGGAGIDTASYASATAAVIASLLGPGGNTGDAAGDTYAAVENLIGSSFGDKLVGNTVANRLEGGGGADTLDGGAANDTLLGGDGADWLYASVGFDSLTGGAGPDRFIFTSVSPQYDTVADFSHAQADKIALASSAFGGLTSLTAGTSFIANGAPGSPTGGPTILYNTTNGWLSYDADGSGAGAAVHVATLTGHPVLVTGDFLFI